MGGLSILNSGVGVLKGNPGGPTGFGQVDLTADVVNVLQEANGGTNANNFADARINLSVYSKADVDAMIAALHAALAGKATAGA